MAEATLNNAVSEAADKLLNEDGTVKEDAEEQEKPQDDSGEEGEEQTEEGEKLSDDEAKEAQFLYNRLKKDPKGSVLELMKAAGIDIPQPETKKEVQQEKKKVIEVLKEHLGDKLAFLAEPFAKAFEQVLEQERQEIHNLRQETYEHRVTSDVNTAIEKLRVETKGESKKFEESMAKLSEKISPESGVSVSEYVQMLYTLASAGSTKRSVSANIADRIRRNANNAPDRISSAGGGSPSSKNDGFDVSKLPKGKRLGGSVEEALRKLQQGSK